MRGFEATLVGGASDKACNSSGGGSNVFTVQNGYKGALQEAGDFLISVPLMIIASLRDLAQRSRKARCICNSDGCTLGKRVQESWLR